MIFNTKAPETNKRYRNQKKKRNKKERVYDQTLTHISAFGNVAFKKETRTSFTSHFENFLMPGKEDGADWWRNCGRIYGKLYLSK